LSENAEYDAAKEAQGLLEMKIAKLEETLANSRVLDASKLDNSKVGMLSKVSMLNRKFNKEMVYTIVSENEANFKAGKISVNSPMAKALMGKKVGDVATVQAPAGVIEYEILNITIDA
jgi:transcription elongation factor GreA